MVFDDKISSTVSLSRILDYFLSSGEDKETVLSFLEMHSDVARQIIDYSECSPRLLSLDFVRRCSLKQVERLSNLICGGSSHEKARWLANECVRRFLWLLFADRTPSYRNMFRAQMDLLVGGDAFRHLYSGRAGRVYRDFDSLFFKLDSAEDYAETVNGISHSALRSVCHGAPATKSLVFPRLLQEDVFCNIAPERQFIILRSLAAFENSISIIKGLKQLLCSEEIPLEARKQVCLLLEHTSSSKVYDHIHPVVGNLSEMVDTFFSKFAMKLELSGMDRFCDWALLWVLMWRGRKFFQNMSDHHKKLVGRYLNILPLLE